MMKGNIYLNAGRYDSLPMRECIGIASSLEALIDTSDDEEYIIDALQRLEALRYRISQ